MVWRKVSGLLSSQRLRKYGLKHPTHSLQVNKMDILSTFDFIHRAIPKDLRDEKQSGKVKTKISNLTHSYVNSYKATLHALEKHRVLKRLANNKDIAILRPDKGSGTVVLIRDEYIKKLSDIISDTSNCKKLSADPTLLREGQSQLFLRKPKNKQFFSNEVYDKIKCLISEKSGITDNTDRDCNFARIRIDSYNIYLQKKYCFS